MEDRMPGSMPRPHREFVDRAVEILAREPWLVGIAASGSFASDTMDAFSDLDLILAIEDDAHAGVMDRCKSIASSLGPLLTAFTSEHVGQPRLLQCLYGPPLLHVDLIFDTLPDMVKRPDELVVVWERDGRMSAALVGRTVTCTEPDLQWIEDRFWVWMHKACGKVGRGELLEVLEYLAFLRSRVLGPLGMRAAGLRAMGVRRVDLDAPELAEELRATVATCDAGECVKPLRACVEVYRRVREKAGKGFERREEA